MPTNVKDKLPRATLDDIAGELRSCSGKALAALILGANPNGNHRFSPLVEAIKENTHDGLIIRAILALGADPELNDPMDGEPPLYHAIVRGNIEAVEALLAANVDIKRRLGRGETYLHIAVKTGNEDIVNSLLNYGADPTVRDKRQLSALDMANSIQSEEKKRLVVSLLKEQIPSLSIGCDPHS